MNTLSPITLVACLLGFLSVTLAKGESENATAPSTSNPSSEVCPTNPPASDDRFRVGQEVTIPNNAGLFTNGDLFRKARAENDEMKRNQICLELSKGCWVIRAPISAKILEIDRESEICKVETVQDGATVQYWVAQEKLERTRTVQPELENFASSGTSKAPYGANERKPATEPEQVQPASGRSIVQMRLSVKEENGKLTVEGNTNLPDATNLLIWVEGNIAGEAYQAQSKVAVENGRFSKAGFSYHGNPLPAGTYKVTVSMAPYGQPQSVKAAVGKGLANLSGPLIKENDGGGKMVKQETEITIGGRNAVDRREQAEDASIAYKEDLIALYRELMDFKDSRNFRAFGFTEGGRPDWKRRAEELKGRSGPTSKARFAAGYLSQLGLEYAFKKGQDTDVSRYCKKVIFEYTGNLDEN